MDVKSIMEIDVENLKREQLEALKVHTINILETIIDHIQLSEFEEVSKYLVHSPAGDSYGTDNYFINFAYNDGDEMDLDDMIDLMKGLSK